MHPYYTTSFVDREMFAYNANYQKMQEEKKTAKQELDRILSQPETRIKYAFQFLSDFGDEEESRTKCYNAIAEWSDKLDTSEAHFWIKMITSKAQMLRVMKGCDGADTLTREEKFQVFVNVCDNMLKEGRMTKATHKRFTEIW